MFRYYLIVSLVVTTSVMEVESSTNAVVNIGTSAAGNVAAFSGTDGTSVSPSTSLTITSTNAALTGNLTANGAAFTNSLTLGGVSVSTATAANPTGTIGLSAVNGSAETFPRSDSAPALPSTGGAYQGAILVPWLTTNATLALQWRKPPVIWDMVDGAGAWNLITVNSATLTTLATIPNGVDQGVFLANTGSLTNGVAGIRSGTAGALFTTNSFAVVWRIYINFLSTDADGFEVYSGFGDSTGDAAPTDGAYFYYLHSVSNGVWTAKTANNTSTTFASGASSTVTVAAATYYDLMVEGNSTVVNFWVSRNDGQSWTWVGFSSSNIPSAGGREFGYETYMRKVVGSTGTTARTMNIGRCEFWPSRGN
jgi:hypothetical protein